MEIEKIVELYLEQIDYDSTDPDTTIRNFDLHVFDYQLAEENNIDLILIKKIIFEKILQDKINELEEIRSDDYMLPPLEGLYSCMICSPEYYSKEILKKIIKCPELFDSILQTDVLFNKNLCADIKELTEKGIIEKDFDSIYNSLYVSLINNIDFMQFALRRFKKMEENSEAIGIKWLDLLTSRQNKTDVNRLRKNVTLWNPLNKGTIIKMKADVLQYFKSIDFYPNEEEKTSLIELAIKNNNKEVISLFLKEGFNEEETDKEKYLSSYKEYKNETTEIITAFFEKKELFETINKNVGLDNRKNQKRL